MTFVALRSGLDLREIPSLYGLSTLMMKKKNKASKRISSKRSTLLTTCKQTMKCLKITSRVKDLTVVAAGEASETIIILEGTNNVKFLNK